MLAWTARPALEDSEDFHLLSVSARGLSHQAIVLDWIVGAVLRRSDDVEVTAYQGEKIYSFEVDKDTPEVAVFVRRGIVFFTTDVETSKQALDRLGRPIIRGAAPTELESAFAAIPDSPPLRGVLSNRTGELQRFVEGMLIDLG